MGVLRFLSKHKRDGFEIALPWLGKTWNIIRKIQGPLGILAHASAKPAHPDPWSNERRPNRSESVDSILFEKNRHFLSQLKVELLGNWTQAWDELETFCKSLKEARHCTGNSYRVAEVSRMITSDSTFGKPIDQFTTFWESDIRKSNFARGTFCCPKMSNLAPCIGQQVLSLRRAAFGSSGLRVRCNSTIFFWMMIVTNSTAWRSMRKKCFSKGYNLQVRIYRGKGSESKGTASSKTIFII